MRTREKPPWPAHDDDGVWYCDAHGSYQCRKCAEPMSAKSEPKTLELTRDQHWHFNTIRDERVSRSKALAVFTRALTEAHGLGRAERDKELRKIDARISAEDLGAELLEKLDGVTPADAAQIGYGLACHRWGVAIAARDGASAEPK